MAESELTKTTGKELLSLDPSMEDIDISSLSKEAQDEIRKYAVRKKIDLQASVHELQKDLQGTSIAVGNMADVTRRMTDSGDAVTVRQTIENTSGKTEILMGNTDEAKRGNVDKENNSWMYIVGGLVVLVIVASVLSNQ